jgi:hypothetical protein
MRKLAILSVVAPVYRTMRVVRYSAPVTYDYGYAPVRYGHSWRGPSSGLSCYGLMGPEQDPLPNTRSYDRHSETSA